ncbi:myb-like protein AA [Teleopsis dalmanni]|uniref:myb-like protein AA n=1 Tax=Teleopsis dalmanni TaxID=139649 RepID=UPI0018CDB11D|nr:myb-like protein AA [Teleopsis dalmanni]
MKRKRLKTGGPQMNILRIESQKYEKQQNAQFQNDIEDISAFSQQMCITYTMSPSSQLVSPIKRKLTSSAVLMNRFNDNSKVKMREILNVGAIKEQTSSIDYMQQQQQVAIKQQQHVNENSLEMSDDTCDKMKLTTQEMNTQNSMSNINNNSIVSNKNNTDNEHGSSHIVNNIINHLPNIPIAYDNNITSLWPPNDSTNIQNIPLFKNLVTPVTQKQTPHQQHQHQQHQYQQHQHQQHQHQQHQQQHQQHQYQQRQVLQNTMEFLPEDSTHNGILNCVNGENFVHNQTIYEYPIYR